MFWMIGISATLILVLVHWYHKRKRGVCRSKADMSGKTVVITGANTGIGYQTALDLATRNARIIFGCRDLQKGEAAIGKIKEETGNNQLVLHELDLSSLKSVRGFARTINTLEAKVDVLLNNAGVTGMPFSKTEEGLEKMFATNHFGPFLLTNLLLEKVKTAPQGRIIFVTSIAHKWGSMDVDNMNSEKYFNPGKIYFNSKMANVMTTNVLAKNLTGTGVTVNSLHPGSIQSDLFRHMNFPLRMLMNTIAGIFFRSQEEGAQCSIFCAVAEELSSTTGKYFEECKVAKEGAQARDEGLCKKLWEVSERIVGI